MKNYPFLLSIISDEISQDPEVAIQLAAEYHLDGIELRSAWDTPVELLPEEKLRSLVELAAENGLKISAIASSFLKEDWCKDDRAKFDRLVKACGVCGCNTIRGFSFWKSEDYTDEQFAEYLKPYDELLGEAGLQLALENDPSVNLNTGYALARFFRDHEFKNIGVLWDPGNDIYACLGKVKSYPDEYVEVKPFMRHFHIKDGLPVDNTVKAIGLGDGVMDFHGQFRALKEDGYTGWITLEPHYRLEGTIDHELLKRPGGAAFSEGGYMPSKISMEWLQKILSELF